MKWQERLRAIRVLFSLLEEDMLSYEGSSYSPGNTVPIKEIEMIRRELSKLKNDLRSGR